MSNTSISTSASAGARFRAALAEEKPLQIVGTINANHSLLAKRAGYRAIYLSGGACRPAPWACRTWASSGWKTC